MTSPNPDLLLEDTDLRADPNASGRYLLGNVQAIQSCEGRYPGKISTPSTSPPPPRLSQSEEALAPMQEQPGSLRRPHSRAHRGWEEETGGGPFCTAISAP
ncbi:unnamed protein product [Boreogadus saida]